MKEVSFMEEIEVTGNCGRDEEYFSGSLAFVWLNIVSYPQLLGPHGHVCARQSFNVLDELCPILQNGTDVMHFEGLVLMSRKIVRCECNVADIATVNLKVLCSANVFYEVHYASIITYLIFTNGMTPNLLLPFASQRRKVYGKVSIRPDGFI